MDKTAIVPFLVHVADVGSGYTTALASDAGTALVDFGGRSGVAAMNAWTRPSYGLPRPLWRWWWGFPWRDAVAHQLLISHPHVDHYNGLVRLAADGGRLPRGGRLLGGPVTFFHPRVPTNPEASEFLLRMIAADVLAGVPETALSNAVLVCSHGPVERRPLTRGDTVSLAGQRVEILWPPATLDDRASSRLRRIVQRYDELAAASFQSDDDRLVRTLGTIRERWPDVETMLYGPGVAEGAASLADVTNRDASIEAPGLRDSQDPLAGVLHELRGVIRSGANLLSLAFTTTDRRYVFLGDLDESLHGEVVATLVDFDSELLVSAHHGTHFGPDLSRLRTRFVASSVGDPLVASVRPEYDRLGTHLTTHRVGDITVYLAERETYLWTGTTRPTS